MIPATSWRLALIAAPVAAIYALLLVIYADWPPAPAMAVAVTALTTAGALGYVVWLITARLPFQHPLRLGFLAAHLGLAVAYTLLWLALDLEATRLLLSDAVFHRKTEAMGWEALLGIWMYGLIAGVSYAVRGRLALEEQRRAAADSEAKVARARLAALRAQLNPHFLFNALHSLGGLARRDPERFDEALERLGELLRQALGSESPERVPLADDLAFAENYLAIERLRLGDRLTVEIAVDESALDVPVPFLTLQPLVENAIRHGIDPVLRGGTIRIAAAQHGGTLTITVSDDGVGFPNGHEPSNGLGLGALRQRLALSYERFELVVDARPDAGCAVRVSIPT